MSQPNIPNFDGADRAFQTPDITTAIDIVHRLMAVWDIVSEFCIYRNLYCPIKPSVTLITFYTKLFTEI